MRRKAVLIWTAVAAVAIAVPLFFLLFAPEGQRTLVEDVETTGDALLGEGSWQGDAGHHVAGTLSLYSGSDGAYLLFSDYKQTAGPDVYLYLSASPDGDFGADRWKVLIPQGTEGRSTVEGTFQVPIPDGVPFDRVQGAIVWCDRFSTPFGHVGLE